jgi:hypothetical protein
MRGGEHRLGEGRAASTCLSHPVSPFFISRPFQIQTDDRVLPGPRPLNANLRPPPGPANRARRPGHGRRPTPGRGRGRPHDARPLGRGAPGGHALGPGLRPAAGGHGGRADGEGAEGAGLWEREWADGGRRAGVVRNDLMTRPGGTGKRREREEKRTKRKREHAATLHKLLRPFLPSLLPQTHTTLKNHARPRRRSHGPGPGVLRVSCLGVVECIHHKRPRGEGSEREESARAHPHSPAPRARADTATPVWRPSQGPRPAAWTSCPAPSASVEACFLDLDACGVG